MDHTTDADIVDDLPEGRNGLEYDDFRARIPDWPGWLRVDGRAIGVGPESGLVFHTRYQGRRFAIVISSDAEAHPDWNLNLYGITDGLLSLSWTQLRTEQAAGAHDLAERVRALRRKLPQVLATCDLSQMGRDGEIDEWDRRYEGARLRWKDYYRWDENWSHDHCVICGATFSLDEPGALTAGYAIQDGPHGDDYDWICRACVERRRGLIAFDSIEDAPEASD